MPEERTKCQGSVPVNSSALASGKEKEKRLFKGRLLAGTNQYVIFSMVLRVVLYYVTVYNVLLIISYHIITYKRIYLIARRQQAQL